LHQRNDYSTTAEVQHFRRRVLAHIVEVHPAGIICRDVSNRRRVTLLWPNGAWGERQRKCRIQKRIGWLLTLWIAGRISRRAFPQKRGNTRSSSFRAFWSVTKRYAELTKSDALIHRNVVAAVHGLVDFLGAERKRVPDDVLRNAERLECLLFSGYDPYFVGDEPPGL
jgi:hypothetical protein